MRYALGAAAVAAMVCLYGVNTACSDSKGKSGELEFKEHCAVCHSNGGNIVNPAKTLQKSAREANNVKTAADIVKIMRNPGPGMTKFDAKTIPDNEAHEIAKYILKTFK